MRHTIDLALRNDVKRLLLDFLAVTVGGVGRTSAVVARSAFMTCTVRDDVFSARVQGTDEWAIPEHAALLNGIASHGLELDDTHEEASMHPAVAIFPAIFAYADSVGGVAWDTFVRAVVVGYDVMTSVGALTGAADSYGRGFHPTAICGSLGAAAAVSVILGLNNTRTSHALGIAANMSAGSLEFLSDGSWTKRLNAGQAASNGLRAAMLGQVGFEAPARFLTGQNGFLHQYGLGAGPRSLVLELGRGIRGTSIKLYPCCRYMHGNIDLLRTIHEENPGLPVSDVVSIECAVISAGAGLVSYPPERKLRVLSPVDAQFNMRFGAALALTTGGATVADFDGAPAVALHLKSLMSRVTCVVSERVETAFPGAWQAEVRVALKDGTLIERYSEAFRGSPGDPADWEEVVTKAAGLVNSAWVDHVGSAIRGLGDCTTPESVAANSGAVTSAALLDGAY
jgi:2-methylcitrate dehydratase PrpD